MIGFRLTQRFDHEQSDADTEDIKRKQGRIHGYPSRVRLGRSSAGEGHWSISAGAVGSKS